MKTNNFFQNEFGCGYYVRLTFSIVAHLTFFACVIAIILLAVTGGGTVIEVYFVLAGSWLVIVGESMYANDLRYLRRGRNAQEFDE